jgi:hypothetical protein
MTSPTPTQWTTLNSLLCDLHMAVATESVKIRFDPPRELGTNLVAKVTGIAARRIEEIVMTSRAFDRPMIMVIEINRQQWPAHDHLITPLADPIGGGRAESDRYKQGSMAHNARSTAGV